jgi:transposase InsO family protein
VNNQRDEFVGLARQADANVSELCRRFGISRKTGYKWLSRETSDDLSRRPLRTPTRTAVEIQAEVIALRAAHPAWGGRTIAHVLARDKSMEVAPSTVTSILHRHGLIRLEASAAATPWHRFEHDRPNSLWQMDFKGWVMLGNGVDRCNPLTVIDDHSRYNVTLEALPGQTRLLVQPVLQRTFERYGLPDRINTDNGAPWGSSSGQNITSLGVWLVRLGIKISHSRPLHPQTNGKDERFHRTLLAEAMTDPPFQDMASAQERFDSWRTIYNCHRPHEAIGMQTPIERYSPSQRPMPDRLPPIEYGSDDEVRNVQACGIVKFKGRRLRTSYALHGEPVAIRPTLEGDGVYDVFYCHQKVDRFDLNSVKSAET